MRVSPARFERHREPSREADANIWPVLHAPSLITFVCFPIIGILFPVATSNSNKLPFDVVNDSVTLSRDQKRFSIVFIERLILDAPPVVGQSVKMDDFLCRMASVEPLGDHFKVAYSLALLLCTTPVGQCRG